MTRDVEEGASANGVVDVEEVERLAGWAAGCGPSWLRAEMRSEARLRVLEALDEGQTLGLGRVAYLGAMGALRAATYQAGFRQSRSAREAQVGSVQLGPWPEVETVRLRVPWGSPTGPVAEPGLGPVFDRLVDELAARGVDEGQVTEALWALADCAGEEKKRNRPAVSSGGPLRAARRGRVHDVSLARMAEQSGLSVPQCAALKVLIIGERARAERGKPGSPGLLARLVMGEDAWSDPRVQRLLAYVAAPSGVLRCAWAEQPAARSHQAAL